MGRLTLNMLLSFAQFEREVTAERIRDKIAASKKMGMWMGGLSRRRFCWNPAGLRFMDIQYAARLSLYIDYQRTKTVQHVFQNAIT